MGTFQDSSSVGILSSRWLWCYLPNPPGGQLRLRLISWWFLLLLSGLPFRIDGVIAVSRPAEDWSRGNIKGTDVLSQFSGVPAKHYKHGEPTAKVGDGFSDKSFEEFEMKGSEFDSQLRSASSEGLGDNQAPPQEIHEIGTESSRLSGKPVPRNLDRLHFGSVVKDCLRVQCSPVASSDVKRSASDEDLPLISKSDSSSLQSSMTPFPHVAIIPSFLEWDSQPVFEHSMASLTVVNTCNSTQLKVFQPVSTDAQFYTVGFEEKVIEPGDELSIPIFFLPRTLGISAAMLIVQTSAGGFLVQAQGKGIASPYKVQTMQGLRLTSGDKLQYTVTVHNPHDEVLRVGEVYWKPLSFAEASLSNLNAGGDPCAGKVVSSDGVSRCAHSQGGDVLRLASEQTDPSAVIHMRPAGQLEINPHSSNPIADVDFAALKVERYLGSLHIKLVRGNQDAGKREILEAGKVLTVPVDVQISEARRDDSPVERMQDVLEFGILTKQDQTRKVNIFLHNPGTDAVQVECISPLLQDQNIVTIEYTKGFVLPPNSKTQVAAVTYMGLEETVPSGLFNCHPRELLRDRKLIVTTNSSVRPNVEIPYRALVFHGSGECDLSTRMSESAFHDEPSDPASGSQRVYFENGLSVPLAQFLILEKTARSKSVYGSQPLSPLSITDGGCCHELSSGHFVVSVGEVSIVTESELSYSVVQIAKEELHWVNLTNPTESPLRVQGFISSKTEASTTPNEDSPNHENSICSQESLSDSADGLADISSRVFYFAEGAVEELVVEPYGTSFLGPVVFRPSRGCFYTGLLSLWNNLTHVEWVPLRGSGGSGSLTFLDRGGKPTEQLNLEFNHTESTFLSGVLERTSNQAKRVCKRRLDASFPTKNTGKVHVDVTSIKFVGGGCSADGFKVDSCQGFSLAPGQTADLIVSYQPDFTVGVFRKTLELITSAGVVHIPISANLPAYMFKLCAEIVQPTTWERAVLFLAIIALVVVLGVFVRMLVQEMTPPPEQVPTASKSVNQPKVGGRQVAPILFSQPNTIVLNKTSNPVVMVGRVKCSSGEPEVQSRTGDGTGASGPGRPKEFTKGLGLVRALKGVADSFTSTVGSSNGLSNGASNGSEVCRADVAPPSTLPGLRVHIPSSAALNSPKSNLGSPMRDTGSPSGNHFRKGGADKRGHFARSDGQSVKIAPDSVEGVVQVPVKGSSAPKSPKLTASSGGLIFSKQGVDAEQVPNPGSTSPINSGVVTAAPMRSPRKGSQFNQPRQVFTPKSQTLSTKSIPQQSNSGVTDKDKNKRKKRRSNMGIVKNELVSKGRSGSSSPSSSPASPATPASPSRPVSPLHHSEMQPTPSTSPGFPSKNPGGALMTEILPLAKLDVVADRQSSSSSLAGKPCNKSTSVKEPVTPAVYRRGDSLSVDVASTALREMAQAKATDLSWSTLSGKANRLVEKSDDRVMPKQGVAKDWATVARKAVIESVSNSKEHGLSDDRCRDRKPRAAHNGHGNNHGPALTPSATFPRRQDRGSEWDFCASSDTEQEVIKPVGSSPCLVPVSTMPPAARAPGAKIASSEYNLDGSTSWGEALDRKDSFKSSITSEDQRVYDIWGNHFGEISRCTTYLPITPASTDGALQSLSLIDSEPSFFSTFSEPNIPTTPRLSPALSGGSSGSGFSLYSQAGEIETFSLPSTLFNSPRVPSRQAAFPEVGLGSNFGLARNSYRVLGVGNSLPGSPRKPRAPYSPPLGPGISTMASNALASQIIPELHTNELAPIYWSGSNLQ